MESAATTADPTADAPAPASRVHWIVRMNWRNRTVFFPLLAVMFALHLSDLGAGFTAWLLLVLQFLVYPQLQYLFTIRQRELWRQSWAEPYNIMLDNLCFTLWCLALGFPLWISFILLVVSSHNFVALMGLRGLLLNAAAIAAGCALGSLWFWPWPWHPDTSLHTTVACMLVFTAYVMVFAHDGYVRARRLVVKSKELKLQLAENSALQVQLREQALRDPLTGLYNRRHLDEALPPALARCARETRPLALVMMDIDHFKRINDTWGHAAGDAVLKALAQLLQSQTRMGDLACRVGGEEFVLVLENTALPEAQQLAEALRLTFAALQVHHDGHELYATLSCGLTMFPEHAFTPGALQEAADQALYAAKQQGRNRTCATPAVRPAP